MDILLKKETQTAADITDPMSAKFKYYVQRLSVTQDPLSMKPAGYLDMSNWKTALRIMSNIIYACFIGQKQPLRLKPSLKKSPI